MFILGLCGLFKWTVPRDLQFLPPPQPPLVFTARSYEALFPRAGTLGWAVWPGAGILPSEDTLLSFYPPQVNVRPPVPPTPLSPHCHHTASSVPWLLISAPPACLDDYVFFKSLVVRLPYSSISWQFWVLFCFEVMCDSS